MGVLRLNGKAYGGGIDVIEVTQAQYNALPESKLSDDILYVISDSVNGSDGYPPLIFSTEEREVGVWTDGKPLYQITIDQTIGSDADYTVIASGIDHAHLVNAKVEYSSGRWMSESYISTSQPMYNKTCYVDVINGALNFHNQSGSQQHWVATIQYTKTTDTAGSGRWTTQGTLAQHYSTTERLIGTWVDGKPIYETTFSFTIGSVHSTVYQTGIANIDRIVNQQGQIDRGDGWFLSLNYSRWDTNSNDLIGVMMNKDGRANIFVNDSFYYGLTVYMTIQYTKTTD